MRYFRHLLAAIWKGFREGLARAQGGVTITVPPELRTRFLADALDEAARRHTEAWKLQAAAVREARARRAERMLAEWLRLRTSVIRAQAGETEWRN